MACDKLDANLGRAGNPAGSVGSTSRPSGPMAGIARMAGGGLCRSFTFAPPVIIPATAIVLFDTTAMTSFAADPLFTF
jgi:hypothetical protein